MRWWSIPIAAALAWFLFTLTPLWSLYTLARAVQSGDTAYVEHHVNFRTLRLSLTRQLTAAIRAGKEGGDKDRQRVADAATALALPLAEVLVTPKMVVDLLDDGWPQSLDLPDAQAGAKSGEGLRVGEASRLLDLYLATEMRGFRTVVVTVPPGGGSDPFRIRMRLFDWSWRLIDIELNAAVRDRIAAAVARAAKSRDAQPSAAGEGAGGVGSRR